MRRRVLIIAASDSSGGAGLTSDAATLTELGTEICCALTAVTVQTDAQLHAIHHLPPELVGAQIRFALESAPVGAIKIGMLGRRATVAAVIAALPSRARLPIVLDPVLESSSNAALLDQDGLQLLRDELLPRVSLLTPNIPEAAALLQESIGNSVGELNEQALRLLRLGPEAVLIKGGHARGEQIVDILVRHGERPVQLATARLPAQRRGTGCSVASAIAAELAAGVPLLEACASGQRHVGQRLQRAL